MDPFIGGANVIDKVDGNRIGSDLNAYVVVLWKAIASGWKPPDHVSEEEYDKASKNRRVDALTAFIGFGCSYSGKFFGGYARGGTNKGEPRNYCAESKRNIMRQAEAMKGVRLHNLSYDRLEIPAQSIVYCDPPYAGTTRYATGEFDHPRFWAWCDDLVAKGHSVFVSEYTAPEHWAPVWEKTVNNSLTQNTGAKQGVERLFAPRVRRRTRRRTDSA